MEYSYGNAHKQNQRCGIAVETSRSKKRVIHLGYGPLVHERTNEGLHVFVQLLKHVWLGEIHWRSVVHIQAVGDRVVAAYMWK